MTTYANSPHPNVACVILGGGKSKRFGSEKAIALFRGRPLLDHIIQRLEAQTSGPIAINLPLNTQFSMDKYPKIEDRLEGDIGPLAGLHSALCWAEDNGFVQVITTPIDTPLLPVTFVQALVSSGPPSVSLSEEQVHALHGIWSVGLRAQLEMAINEGLRAARVWAARCGAKHCNFAADSSLDPFYNVNTPQDLKELERKNNDLR